MEAEEVLKFFDYCWFEREIFKQLKHNMHQSDQESMISCGVLPNNLQIRSLSALCLGDYFKETASSRSVIIQPKLQKIISGKELVEFAKGEKAEEKQFISLSEQEKAEEMKKRKKKRTELKRSISALEFEEVKGFMDLGFVFTEEDKSSSLVSIIPGLQKWGKAAYDEKVKLEKAEVKRPYLSEAWGVLNKGKVYKSPVMEWGINSFENEISLKNHLKVWAQSVASTVR